MATCEVLKEEFLTCIICHEVFRDPVTLHCGHTLCSQCVTAFTKTQTEAAEQGCIACPHCRGLTKVPNSKQPIDEWTGQLKTGFFVKGLVERFASAEKVDKDNCTVCDDDDDIRKAVFWCSDCGHALCSHCQRVHRKLNKHHEVSDISEREKRRLKKVVCRKHPDFIIDLLCEDCDQAVCQRCCTLHHRKCETVIMLKDAMSKICSFLEDYRKQVEDEVKDVQSDISAYETYVDRLLASSTQAEKDIDAVTEKLIMKIHEKQTQAKAELQSRKEEKLQKLTTVIKKGEMRLEEIRQRQSFLLHALDSADTNTRYEAYKLFQNSSTNVRKTQPEADNEVGIVFSDKSEAVLTLLDKNHIGHIEVCRKRWRIRPTLMENIDTRLAAISGITVMYPFDIKTIVVASSLSHCIKSSSNEDNILKENLLTFDNQVFGITKTSEMSGVASLYPPRKIVFFTLNPKLKVTKTVNTKKQYLCLVYLSSETLGASSHLPGCIDIIDMSGTVLRTFGHGNVDYPRYISVGREECLLVSDVQNSRLMLLNHHGQNKFETKPPRSKYQGVCRSNGGEVFVVDSGNEKVMELSHTGKYVQDILECKDGIRNPCIIFVDRNMIYVSVDHRYIAVYQFEV